MSIILEALRKSEAARRRNEAPELFAAMPTAAEPAAKRSVWPFWTIGMIGTVGIASLALALWLMTHGDRAARDGDAVNVSADAKTGDAEPDASESGANPAETVMSSSRHAPGSPVSDIPTPPTAAPMAAPMPIAAVQPPKHTQVVPAATVPTTMPTTIAVAPPPRDPALGVSSAPVPSNTMPPNIAPHVAPPVAPSVSANEPAAPDPFRSPANNAPLTLADLDVGTRKQLPPLKLSMHVWNDVASQRFVILDGQRLREGDVLGELVVERITHDGAMLSWRGTSLKIEWR